MTFQEPSPLIEASYAGDYSTVSHLLYTLPLSSLDETATVKNVGSSQGDLHNCTALNIACIKGYADIAKSLLEAGASHSIRDCTGSAPFSEAVYHNQVHLIPLLAQYGADVNTVNSYGWTPLHVAAFQGNLQMVEKLLNLGVDVTGVTPEGYTAMHMAAMTGRTAIVTYLLEKGLSLSFAEACPGRDSSHSYTPCPLFLAVVGHFKSLANKFLQHRDCPLSCRADSMMLNGAVDVLDSRIAQARTKWSAALKLRDDHHIPLHPSPSSDYDGRCELTNLTKLNKLFDEGDRLEIEAIYQSVLIWERCVGALDQRYWIYLKHLVEKLVNVGQFDEAERVIIRGLKVAESAQLPLLEKGCLLPQNFEVFYGDTLNQMVLPYLTNPAIVSLESTFSYIFTTLDILICRGATLYTTFGCPNFVPKFLLSIVLQMFEVWLAFCDSDTPYQFESREAIGQNFVSKYLHLSDGSNLLFTALQSPLRQSSTKLIEALLVWGAKEVVNSVCNSQRLFQAVAKIEKMPQNRHIVASPLLKLLVSYGVHGDAVDRSGKTAIECCPELFGTGAAAHRPLLPLACLAAHTIINDGLPYQDMPSTIAPRLRRFIMMHDVKVHQSYV